MGWTCEVGQTSETLEEEDVEEEEEEQQAEWGEGCSLLGVAAETRISILGVPGFWPPSSRSSSSLMSISPSSLLLISVATELEVRLPSPVDASTSTPCDAGAAVLECGHGHILLSRHPERQGCTRSPYESEHSSARPKTSAGPKLEDTAK